MSEPHLSNIYRDFDIRGRYPDEINEAEVYKIARALVTHYSPKKVAIGYDYRPSAVALRDALLRGFTDAEITVIDLGLCTTPMSYFMCGSTDTDLVVMVTASHMPAEFNGLKITVEDAKPVTGDILQIIRSIVGTHTFSETATHSEIQTHALQEDYIQSFKRRHNLKGAGFSVVIDPANMVGILEIPTFQAFAPDITVHTLFDTFDHTCPNHEANPLKRESLTALSKEVMHKKADLGVAFDGDADRIGFVDELGTPISSDHIGSLLARVLLQKYPGAKVVCDIRTSKATREEIERLGGIVLREKVGHTHIRSRMRKDDAVLGVELSGHFFFKETYYSEGGSLPAFLLMELMLQEQKPLSVLVQEVQRYSQSGEINNPLQGTLTGVYEKLRAHWPEATVSTLDGLLLETPTWWLSLRPSANDPVVRLNVEADTAVVMKEIRDTALKLLTS